MVRECCIKLEASKVIDSNFLKRWMRDTASLFVERELRREKLRFVRENRANLYSETKPYSFFTFFDSQFFETIRLSASRPFEIEIASGRSSALSFRFLLSRRENLVEGM